MYNLHQQKNAEEIRYEQRGVIILTTKWSKGTQCNSIPHTKQVWPYKDPLDKRPHGYHHLTLSAETMRTLNTIKVTQTRNLSFWRQTLKCSF